MLGVSYDGWTTIMGAIEPHPALKAISPQASPADMWLGDDFHHNGAFRLSYGFEYAAMMESGKDVQQFTFDRYDTFDWYLSLGSLANVNAKYLHGKIPTWNDYVAHPDYDEFWKRQTMIPHLTSVKVPTLNVAGWWDQEDFYGPVRIYDALERFDTPAPQLPRRRAVAPRRVGGRQGRRAGRDPVWQRHGRVLSREGAGAVLRVLPEGQRRARFAGGAHVRSRRERVAAMGRSGRRRDGPKRAAFYFGPNETLVDRDRRAPGARSRFDEFVSDPGASRCRIVIDRSSRRTSPAGRSGRRGWSRTSASSTIAPTSSAGKPRRSTSDLTIAGEVVAHLFASTTGSDADWIVKLIDVYPEDYPTNWDLAGFQLMVSNEVFRGRYRTSFEKPAPIEPDKVLEYTWSLHTQNYTFKKGHRVMVQVQSTWFPIIDRNPQTFVPNIFEATGKRLQGRHASRLSFPRLSVARRRSGGRRICRS